MTAYLIAITPDIQASRKRKVEAERASDVVEQKAVEALAAAPAAVADTGAPAIDEARAKEILTNRCVDCHELEDVENYGGSDIPGWSKVLTDMVEEGAEITEDEAVVLAAFLAQTYPKQ